MPMERPDLTINTPQHHWMTQSWRHIPHTYIFETIETIQNPEALLKNASWLANRPYQNTPK